MKAQTQKKQQKLSVVGRNYFLKNGRKTIICEENTVKLNTSGVSCLALRVWTSIAERRAWQH